MQNCTEHVRYQVTNNHTRICSIFDAIETSYASLLASMSKFEEDVEITGKSNNFESTFSYLLTKYPGAKRVNKYNTINQDQISNISAQGQGFYSKVGSKNNVVHFIYHTNHKYHDLNDEKKKDHGECRLMIYFDCELEAIVLRVNDIPSLECLR